MIQRPQTLFYLALVAICLMLLFSDIVFYTATNQTQTETFNVEYDETEILAKDGTSKEQNTLLMSFIGAVGILAMVAMLMFKNRKLQTLLSGFNFTSCNSIFLQFS